MDNLLKDIRYGIRGLLKRPGFTLVAVITLALGIGANTAIFTLVNAVLLKSLPVSKPEQLVLFSDARGEGTRQGDPPPSGAWDLFSYDAYKYIKEHDQSFQAIAAFRSGESRLSVTLPGSTNVQRAQSHLVSGNYFSLMGVNARLGRVLTPDDDLPNANPTAVVSYTYWEKQLNSDPSIIGKTLSINNANFTLVGVTPKEFFGERVRKAPDFWLPLVFQPQIEMRKSALEDKETYWLSLIGRLRDGVSINQAQLASTISLRQFLTEQAGSQLNDDRKRAIEQTSVEMVPGGQGISSLRFYYSKPLHMLMAIVGMVLLIACANVGSLFLSRAAGRSAEMSLRLALGASRLRIIRQLLTESLLLALCGGIAGILLAQWGVRILVSLVTKETPLETSPDLLVLSFTALAATVSGLLFGLMPAIRASRTDLAGAMKEKTRTNTGRSRFGVASALIVTQVCLSMVLLTGAGLFARSLLKLQQEDVGFNRDKVLLVSIDPRLAGYKGSDLPSLYQRLMERVKTVPGIAYATVATGSPMSGSRTMSDISVLGYTPAPKEQMIINHISIGSDFSKTLGVPLLQGRDVVDTDTAAGRDVAVVNQAFVDHYFKNQNPVGRIFWFGDDPTPKEPIEIVGVIGNMKSVDAREAAPESVYLPIWQDEDAFSGTVHIRTHGEANELTAAVRAAITQVDPKLPIVGVTTLSEQVQSTLKQDRLIAQLVSFFGILALLLAAIGLYGVMSHGVVRRTNEIGIRMALGARRTNILWLILSETLILVAAGLLVGIPLALGSGKLISSQLFDMGAIDPLALLIAGGVLTTVALLAGYLPARRATRVDPLVALRDE
jgi:predicted permease